MTEVIRQNLFFDLNKPRIPFLGKYNYAFISITPEHLQIIQDYEKQKIELYGDKYKSIIVDKTRPLIRVKYDDKSKLFKNQEELDFEIKKGKYSRIVIQAKNIYIDSDVVTTHWRIQYVSI